ncbi:hypothetical protein [Nocardia transvalensis]|uniref:hypothetical protein n=1 Tax=Nocardia transvalensis TaxID=37333 RepID=UPI0018950DCD|nr:hypothetical protein [Nocardia transvalensis]MBF6333543.1 hypothetical protein [Nocardia transvalensis]
MTTRDTASRAERGMSSAVQAAQAVTGASAAVVTWDGIRAAVAYSLDPEEVARRAEARMAPIDRWDVIDALLHLPEGCPVPSDALSSRHLRALRAAPDGAVTTDAAGRLHRHAIPPIRVQLAVVPMRRWRDSLHAAGQFAPHCQRMIAIDNPTPISPFAAAEATFWGIGIAAGDDRESAPCWTRNRTCGPGIPPHTGGSPNRSSASWRSESIEREGSWRA